ncbi:glycosyltransferase [Clostridium butyricum]|uniref:glycosyltransferase n=1 Tax=Clostridium butyricum TaxID=1492 RepID=UPI0003F8E04C|nr:glycosyltransferase [Clostridium butyricum]
MKRVKKKILFLTTELPCPADNGGKIRSFNMLKSIYDSYEIDLVCFSEKNEVKQEVLQLKKICNEVYVVNKIYTNSKSKVNSIKNVLMGVLKNKPFIVEKFNDSMYKSIVKMLIHKNEYQSVIIDHLQISNYLSILDKQNVILSQHNCEYLILKRRYEKENNIIKKIFIWSEFFKTKKYEKKICSKVNKVIVLSEEDKKHIVDEDYRGDNMVIIPISVETTYVKKHYNNTIKNLLFLGTMSWYPNEHGILWFLNNVWKDILKYNSDIKLYIVGNKPSEEIRSYSSENVIVTGYVESVDEYIEKCDVCIVPLFIGGGMRVKILECMSKGIPCISTSIGAEGIEYIDKENIIICDTSDQLLHSINNMSKYIIENKLVENAKMLIEEKYSLKVLSNKLKKLIEQ